MRPGIEALAVLSLFRAAAPPLLAKINEIADLARTGPDETLLVQGETPTELNILLSGYAVSTQARLRAVDRMTDLLVPVTALGLPAALLGLPAVVNVRTVTAARLIVIPAPELRDMIHKEPSLAPLLLSHALEELHALTAEVCELKLRTTAQRLAAYLLSLITDPNLVPVRFVLPFEKRFIAAKLGCSQENLSRALAALRRLGVDTRRGIVVLEDTPALRSFAGLSE